VFSMITTCFGPHKRPSSGDFLVTQNNSLFYILCYKEIIWRWPLMKAKTCRDHREHEIKHILLIVANEGFVLWFNSLLLRNWEFKSPISTRLLAGFVWVHKGNKDIVPQYYWADGNKFIIWKKVILDAVDLQSWWLDCNLSITVQCSEIGVL
jgi:hypothetical protein